MENTDQLAIERLKKGIITIASELDFDMDMVKGCVETLNKDELIIKFIELKELSLKQENARLIELLLE